MASSEIGEVASRAAANRATPVKTSLPHTPAGRRYRTITNPRSFLRMVEETAEAAGKAAAQGLIKQAFDQLQETRPAQPKGSAEAEEPETIPHEPSSHTADADALVDAVVTEIQERQSVLNQIIGAWNDIMRGIVARLYLACAQHHDRDRELRVPRHTRSNPDPPWHVG